MIRLLITGAVFLFAGMLFLANAADLVKNGKCNLNIVTPVNDSPSTKVAVEELDQHIKKFTGEMPSSGALVPARANLKFLLKGEKEAFFPKGAKISDEGFVIRIKGNEISISAEKPIGLLYGVYTFLERYVGVRWFFPGEEGTYIPPKKDITLPDEVFVSTPSFQERLMVPTGGNAFSGKYGAKDTFDWLVRNKVQFRISLRPGEISEYLAARGGFAFFGNHDIFTKAIPDSLLKEHPEYFCLVNGERLPQRHPGIKVGGCTYAQICTSNPGALKRVADSISEALATEKKTGIPVQFEYAAGDNCKTWCHCPDCKRLFKGSTPDRFSYMVNKTFEEVVKEYPDAREKLYLIAYSDFRTLPKYFPPQKELKLHFTDHGRCLVHRLDDPSCKRNVAMLALLKEWCKVIPPNRIRLRDYYCVSTYAPYETIMASDLKLLHKEGLMGYGDEITAPDAKYPARTKENCLRNWDIDISELWFVRWQQIYLSVKLMWDVNADSAKLLDDANRFFYGPAYPAMEKERALISKLWANLPEHSGYGTTGTTQSPGAYCLGMPDGDMVDKYFKEALALAKDEPYKYRVEREYKFFKKAWLEPYQELQKKQKVTGSVNQISVKPNADGFLPDSAWARASVMGVFSMKEGKKPTAPTYVKACFDNKNLYLSFTCVEPKMEEIKTLLKKGEKGEVYLDNCIELMINPTGKSGNYYYFNGNAAGATQAMQLVDGVWNKTFNPLWRYSASQEKDRWKAQIVIPFSSLGVDGVPVGKLWNFNFGRTRRLKDATNELSSIANGVYHGGFVTFMMGESILRNGSFNEVADANLRGSWKIPSGKMPKFWNLSAEFKHRGAKPEAEAFLIDPLVGEYELRLQDGYVYQMLDIHGKSLPIKVSFTARGKGVLKLNFFRYCFEKISDLKKVRKFIKGDTAGTVQLTEDAKQYTFTYTNKPDEELALAFSAQGEAFINNVVLELP